MSGDGGTSLSPSWRRAAPDAATPPAALDGAALRWPWALPFVGILLTIATGPLLFPRIWHDHYGKLAFVWGALDGRAARRALRHADRVRRLRARRCWRNI